MLPRRALLAGSAAAFVVGCGTRNEPAPPRSPSPSPSPSPRVWGPFDVPLPSTVRVVANNCPIALVPIAGATQLLNRKAPDLNVIVQPTSDLAHAIDWDSPPDLIFNDGSLPLAEIAGSLLDLTPLLESLNHDGNVIRSSLYTGTRRPAQIGNHQLGLPYSLVAHGLWYSETEFTARGWAPPATWAELTALANDSGDRPFIGWDRDHVGDVLDLIIASAVKETGLALRDDLEKLGPSSWRAPAIASVLERIRELVVAKKFVEVEGSALGAWAVGTGPLMMSGGATVLRETSGVLSEGFKPTASPVPTLSTEPALRREAVQSQAEGLFMVPKDAPNAAGGLELMRAMFSQEVAEQFTTQNRLPSTLRGAIPPDALPSLQPQVRLLEAAGTQIINWRFLSHYGIRAKAGNSVASFLRGNITTAKLVSDLQSFSDAARNDKRLTPLS